MDSQTALIILALASLAGLATLLGVGLALWLGRNERAISLGMGLSAGLMVCMSLLDLLPGAMAYATATTVWAAALLGAGAIAILHYVIPHIHLQEELAIGPYKSRSMLHASLLVAFGLVLHDFPEGMALANAYVASPKLGLLVAIAILLHNIPEQFAIAMPAVKTGRKRLLFIMAFVAGLAEPLGALLGIILINLEPGWHAAMMALAAGAMIYVSFHELLPLARRFAAPVWVLSGILLGVLLYLLIQGLLQ